MKNIFTLLFVLITTLSFGQVVTWNFFGASSPTVLTSTTSNPNAESPIVLSRGAGATASTATNSFRTQLFQDNGVSTANTDYFEFSVKANTGYLMTLTSIDATFRGTAAFAATPGVTQNFAYRIDAGAFTFVNTDVIVIGNASGIGSSSFPFNAATSTALQNIPSTSTVTFRYYASGQTTTGGWGFYSASAGSDNLVLNGSLNTILPITISTLSASKNDKAVQLDWTMSCTSNNVTYAVERSYDGFNFLPIFKTTVTRERCKDPFQFTDNTVGNGTVFYRIKSNDIDANYKLSEIAKVEITGAADIKIFPTTTTGLVTVDYNANSKTNSTWMVYSATGKLVQNQARSLQQGQNRFTIDLSRLPAGTYYISGVSDDGKTSMQQITKR